MQNFRYESTLCVADLTPPASIRPGHLYAIAGEDDAYAASLLWSMLLDAGSQGQRACLISPAHIDNTLLASGLTRQVENEISANNLFVLEVVEQDENIGNAERARRMLEDLRHWGKSGGLLVVNGAEVLFPSLDIDTVRVWRDWAESRGSVVMMIFRDHDGSHSITSLGAVMHLFTGIGQLKSRYGSTSLDIFHWFNESGMIAAKTFPLYRDANGALQAYEVQEDAVQAPAPAADEAQIIAMKSVFQQKEKMPEGWRMVDDDLDVLHALATGAVAATVIIAFHARSDFNRIAHCIFHLRKLCGPRLKIMVREVNARLRYSQEQLAIRMGANLIVPAEISYVRFLSLTSMVQGQVFPHVLPATYEQALKEAMPEQEQGYLPPTEFAQAVLTALAHSRVLNVQVALVKLPLAYGLMPLDALRYCKIRREGDLCTSDENSVYVFLYACRENDIEATLDRLFTLPVDELFMSENRLLSLSAIETTMRDYEMRRLHGHFPDLTIDLNSIEETLHSPLKETFTAAPHAGPAVVRYATPPLAVQRPLTLRSGPTLTDVSAPQT